MPTPHPVPRRETTGHRSPRRRCRHRLQLQPSGPLASPLYIASQQAARAAAAAAAAIYAPPPARLLNNTASR